MTTMDRITHKITRKKIPILGRILDAFNQLHPFFQSCAIATFMLWKIFIVYFVLFHGRNAAKVGSGDGTSAVKSATDELGGNTAAALRNHAVDLASASAISRTIQQAPVIPVGDGGRTTPSTGDAPGYDANALPIHSTDEKKIRVLHIVTALRDINNGQRGTKLGQDRLTEVFIPVLKSAVESMVAPPYNYQVDVYLVLGWTMTDERKKLVEDALPEGVGLQIWHDAIPLGYDRPKTDVKMKPVTRGLARQHRFVIKDKLEFYDLFTVFEDDMRVTGQHVAHYLEMSAELEKLVEEAPDKLPKEPQTHENQHFYGPLSKKQLKRMMPGFIRAEVLLDESRYPSQKELDPIPVTFDDEHQPFDPKPCCHVPDDLGKMPPSPTSEQIMIWETAVKGTVVREMPKGGDGLMDWVMLQPGPKIYDDRFIGGYWSGRLGFYGNEQQPGAGDPRLIAQQGGWMATRDQLIEMHTNQCANGFFPPYEPPLYNQDGLTLNNVEFWSGGFSIFSGTKAGCSMQRVISLKPEHFGRHFLYHTANNKQISLPNFRLLKANNFLGQINTVVKKAKEDRPDE